MEPNHRSRRRGCVWALLIAVAATACEDRGREDPRADAPPATAAASALGLDGEPVDPLADARADALIFVRADCPISNRYAPKLARVAERFADQPVDLWLVYVDSDETAEVIAEHQREYSLPITALRDPDQALVARAGVEVTPSVAVYDADGARRYRGRIDDWYVDYGKSRAQASTNELVDAIAAALAKRDPAVTEAAAVGCPIPPLRRGDGA